MELNRRGIRYKLMMILDGIKRQDRIMMKERIMCGKISRYDGLAYQYAGGCHLYSNDTRESTSFVGIKEGDQMIDLLTGEEIPIIPTEDNRHHMQVVSYPEGLRILYGNLRMQQFQDKIKAKEDFYEDTLSYEGVKDCDLHPLTWDEEAFAFWWPYYRQYCEKTRMEQSEMTCDKQRKLTFFRS